MYNTISISGYHIREAGSTAAQEVAFTLANAVAYVEAALAAGLSIDDFAPRLSFFFAAHNDLFEEVAKFRAARQIWAELVRDRFRSRDEKSMLLRFHTQTGGSTLTAQQPENNIVRTAIQALAGVLGGTQSLHTNSYDEALGLPTEKSVEIALRTQQIIAHESGAAATVDPLGGSYYIEYLTAAMDKRIRALLAEIESRGGAVACIENGYFRDEIAAAAYDFQRRVETRRQIVVGVNEFTSHSPGIPAVLRVDPELERNQVRELAKLKATRDRKAVAESLAAVRDAARQNKNVVEPIIDAVAHYATVGEISDIFREVWGEYHENL